MGYWILILALSSALAPEADARNDKDCPALFQRYSSKHSYCQPANSACEILAYYPTEEQRDQIMSLHNKYRSQLASGKTKLPSSTNMLQMEWDEDLAAVAQKYTEQCLYKHDCSNCRKTENFGVGQNIAMQKTTGTHEAPQPDWEFAVKTWFEEIKDFPNNLLCDFKDPNGQGEYRHFTQIAWAKTFRVGCGYVLYREGGEFDTIAFVRLYICDYGPTGNSYGDCLYEGGSTCSNCPSNTCCGSSCSGDDGVEGLCKRTDSKAPNWELQKPHIFYCNFRDTEDCDVYIQGDPSWETQPTLEGNFMGTTLSGGGNTTLVFSKHIQPDKDEYCMTILYRKGPHLNSDEDSSVATVLFTQVQYGESYTLTLPTYKDPARQQFNTFNLTLSWDEETEIKVNFVVPKGKPKQFFEIKNIMATNGACMNIF